MLVGKAKLAYLDVETTGLSPARGDRIVEIGVVACRGKQEVGRLSWLVNPDRPIPADAQRVHRICDGDVADCPEFRSLAQDVCAVLHDTWIVGHNVRFDAGFMAMEIASADHQVAPLGCLDTCQLAQAMWDLPNYRLETVVTSLRIPADRQHRALDDALQTRAVFDRVVEEAGGWSNVSMANLQALHSYVPAWPNDFRRSLPGLLYDALANGREVAIGYVAGDGQASSRVIRPVGCFPAGRRTYVRAQCTKAGKMRTFRLDRMVFA
jgi:DNA polymerase III epsilon subunit family exonuclease